MTKKTTLKQEVVVKKPKIAIENFKQGQLGPKFDFKKPFFNKRGPSFKTAFKTQNRGGK